jgi:alpha-tubulin suppressor-like RCC1 family protein
VSRPRSSKALLLALASVGATASIACGSAPTTEPEETAAANEALLGTVHCAWHEWRDCEPEGIHGQTICSCVPNPPPTVAEIALGQSTAYALDDGGGIYSWGAGAHYARGDGKTGDTSTIWPLTAPTINRLLPGRPYEAVHLAAGDTGAIALERDGSVLAWGTVAPGVDWSTPAAVAGVTGVSLTTRGQIAHGANHACAIVTGGAVWCWGANDQGQLGDQTSTSRATAAPISTMGYDRGAPTGLPPFLMIAAGGNTTCGLAMDGRVWCWGDGSHGALGQGTDGSGIHSAYPLATYAYGDPAQGYPTPTWIQGGGSGTFCAGTDNEFIDPIVCWGDNEWGQAAMRANGPKDAPSSTDLLTTDAPLLAFGKQHTCFGGAFNGTTPSTICFGDDHLGQLGNGVVSGPSYSAVSPKLDQFRAVAAGGNFACGVPTNAGYDGSDYLACWGQNDHGQLGDGSSLASPPPPTLVPTEAYWYP